MLHWNELSRRVAVVGAAGIALCTAAHAQNMSPQKLDENGHRPRPADSAPLPGTFVAIENGFRLVPQDLRMPTTAQHVAQLQADGKWVQFDAQTGEMIVPGMRVHLPANWIWSAPEGQRIDSYGNPIVNETLGLPAWSQRDIAELMNTIAERRVECEKLRSIGQDTTELDSYLGNFIGQAIVRGLPLDGVVDLSDPTTVTPAVTQSVLAHLHAYENTKFVVAPQQGVEYTQSLYPAAVEALAASAKTTLTTVLTIEAPLGAEEGGIASVPSGCYYKETLPAAMDFLSGATILWEANGIDDAAADIELPFWFDYFTCESWLGQTSVRVSTNGYVCMKEHGGTSANGLEYINVAIPTPGGVDGMIAGWWDDLQVMQAQGAADRVQYKVVGAVGERQMIIEWYSMSRRNGDATDFHSFQIILSEQEDKITLAYPAAGWGPDSIDSATVGIEGFSGVNGECGANCGATNNTAPVNNLRFTPLANDKCADAQDIAVFHTYTGTLLGALNDGVGGCSTNGNPDVWYHLDVSCTGTLTVTTCGSHDAPGTDLGPDTVLSLHTACPGTAANAIACNDDDDTYCTGQLGNHRDATISHHVTAGQQFWIRVSHWNTSIGTGKFTLTTNFAPDAPAANDSCAAAQLVSPNSTVTGSLNCATPSVTNGGCGVSNDNRDVWYRVFAPHNGKLRVTACGTQDHPGEDLGMDPVIALYSSCPSNPSDTTSLWDCNDDPVSPTDPCGSADEGVLFDSIVTKPVAAGEQVLIRVSHYSTTLAGGYFQVQVGFIVKGDMNCDGLLNNFDIDPFVLALTNAAAWQAAYPSCNILNGDIDGNDLFNNFDIDPFVNCITNGCP